MEHKMDDPLGPSDGPKIHSRTEDPAVQEDPFDFSGWEDGCLQSTVLDLTTAVDG